MTRATMKQFAVFEESDDGSEGEGNSGRVVKVLKKIEIFFAEFDVVQCLVCFSVWSHPSPQVLSLLKY